MNAYLRLPEAPLTMRIAATSLLYSLLCVAGHARAQEKLPEAPEPVDSAVGEEAPSAPEKVEVQPVANDAQIAQRLQSILEATGWFDEPQVRVQEGVVFLRGRTRTQAHKEWAGKLATSTQDVAAAVNNLTIIEGSVWDFSPAWKRLREMGRVAVQALPGALVSLVLLGVTWLGVITAARLGRRIGGRRVRNPLLIEVFAKVVAAPVILLGVYFALRVSNLTGLAATVLGGTGLIGLVIGIAFRDIVENFLASILVSMQRPYRAGDLISVADQTGFVQKVTTRGTLLVTLEGNHVQVPNATIYKSVIRNFSANPNVRLDFVAPMRYDRDAARGQDVVLGVLREHEAVLAEPEPLVLVEELASPIVKLHAYFWINGRTNSALKVRSALLRLSKCALDVGDLSPVPPAAPPVAQTKPDSVLTNRTPTTDGKRAVAATAAEGGLQSERKEIRKQARGSRELGNGADLLATG
jgi:small conductance mechanosensitive channel